MSSKSKVKVHSDFKLSDGTPLKDAPREALLREAVVMEAEQAANLAVPNERIYEDWKLSDGTPLGDATRSKLDFEAARIRAIDAAMRRERAKMQADMRLLDRKLGVKQ